MTSYSSNRSSHCNHVRQALVRLCKNSPYVELEKCLFERLDLRFLGYILSVEGLQMDPDKQSTVLNWPHPVGLRAIQHFIGFTNYYRQFIPHFSSLVAPIVAITKKSSNHSSKICFRHVQSASSMFGSCSISDSQLSSSLNSALLSEFEV
ncbi:uncharacterized protein [Dendropsophus ebraccatus]|uniref:uncharacterized protein n=1 Tax=Dendropsophus ebraccatus TaxID=150705 RepID=UPI0038320D0C